jgi:CelD/BcsL family acetyltransferase involved in cellulose biosynthesis
MRRPDATASGTQTEAVASLAALEALRAEWERLWAEAPQATPFQSPQWLLPWWKHVGDGELASVAVRCAGSGELVGLAPLYIHRDAPTGRRHLFPIGIGTTDYLDWLAKPGHEEGVIAAVTAHLTQRRNQWDVLEAPQLREDAMLLATTAAPPGWRREVAQGEPNPVLDLTDRPPHALLPIPGTMAANLRACRAKAARAGTVSHELADAPTLPDLLETLFRLHSCRWAQRDLPGVLRDGPVLAWHREAAPRLHARGLLRLHGLRLNGELIAVLYCLADATPAHRRRCYYYIGGFDPRFAQLSPGTLLVAHAIEHAMAEGATAFDFLRGAEAYKYRWGALDQPMYTLRLWH